MSHLKALLKEDGRGLSRLHSMSSPGASEWLNALPIYESLWLSDDLFWTAVHHHLSLPPLCWLAFDIVNVAIVRRMRSLWQLTCFDVLREVNVMPPIIFSETLCCHAAMEVSGIMPVLQKRGRPYIRRLDVVATLRSGGPRVLLHVVLVNALQPGAPTPTVPGWATHHAEKKKERHYKDHPRGDHFFPCAMDILGGFGMK
eukprot:SM000096S24913  [mRNA]  locus=s96:557115:557737:- [translate_table: standard]